jgi:hypothetical protein
LQCTLTDWLLISAGYLWHHHAGFWAWLLCTGNMHNVTACDTTLPFQVRTDELPIGLGLTAWKAPHSCNACHDMSVLLSTVHTATAAILDLNDLLLPMPTSWLQMGQAGGAAQRPQTGPHHGGWPHLRLLPDAAEAHRRVSGCGVRGAWSAPRLCYCVEC